MPMPPLVLNGEIAGVFFRVSLQDGVYPIPSGRYPVSAFFPIPGETRYGSALGLLLCPINDRNFSEMELGCAKMTAAAITRYINQ